MAVVDSSAAHRRLSLDPLLVIREVVQVVVVCSNDLSLSLSDVIRAGARDLLPFLVQSHLLEHCPLSTGYLLVLRTLSNGQTCVVALYLRHHVLFDGLSFNKGWIDATHVSVVAHEVATLAKPVGLGLIGSGLRWTLRPVVTMGRHTLFVDNDRGRTTPNDDIGLGF